MHAAKCTILNKPANTHHQRRQPARNVMDFEQTIILVHLYQSWLQNASDIVSIMQNASIMQNQTLNSEIYANTHHQVFDSHKSKTSSCPLCTVKSRKFPFNSASYSSLMKSSVITIKPKLVFFFSMETKIIN
ncbi:hypothetical protein QN277_009938 [Acacia crassicarpa]|uniref:Uncharacterized protein n=1 Tax=Acacia crassicarpa TaxID=499986 RepID=A0AAE1M6D9_9FABA|nr:hypothetical protein QN277_009938 [Acacia crassicarpa]